MFLQLRSLCFVALALMVAPSLGQLNTQCNLFGTVGDCSQFVDNFCATVNPLNIRPNDSISKCYSSPGDAFRCDFTVLNTLNEKITPSGTNCRTALTTATRSCSKGGKGQFSGAPFVFAFEPTIGTCELP